MCFKNCEKRAAVRCGLWRRCSLGSPISTPPIHSSKSRPLRFNGYPWGEPIPRHADVVILFGSKSTNSEISFIRAQGWDHDILAHARTGGRVLGLCDGYQMLGEYIHDPHGYDGVPGTVEGLGLLQVSTTMQERKTVKQVEVQCAISGLPVKGY